ncbi:cysteine desulfurase family protein [Natranaerobius trueperi]|uniref:Cysteine desulfurase NifS n=1 Tax=Natranaerobius trueperi TaxID=759412 RepID=A0A226C3F2_9FIRM|nr:cysteine desulfurase family protein [Natranaerobius trueperi]OWZ84940.1 cysteine desulfurase NifS [Natranaerobius trueperi]
MQVYLDNSATTQVDKEVADIIYKVMTEKFGNPSSLHSFGVNAEDNVQKVRKFMKKVVKSQNGDFIFTSGGTEANNLAIRGTAYRKKRMGDHLITSQVEHPSVIEVFKQLEAEGYRVSYLPVDENGRVDPRDLQSELTKNTTLVSVQTVNNEVGTMQPIAELGKVIRESGYNIVFHTDAVQAIGKIDLDPEKWGVHLLSVSAHKFHGPKGIGGLYISPDTMITPQLIGGGQERDIRPGTENVQGIVGLGKALEKAIKNKNQFEKITEYKLKAYKQLKEQLGDELLVLGPDPKKTDKSAPHILAIAFPDINGEVIVHGLEQKGVYVSTGSACSSNKDSESQVLLAMSTSKRYVSGAIRLSFSYKTTEKELEYATEQIIKTYNELKSYGR